MKNIAVFSLIASVFVMSACTKGCKKQEPVTPPIEEKAPPAEEKPMGEQPPASGSHEGNEKEKMMNELKLQPGDKLYAHFNTNAGVIKAELFWDKAPKTVSNFVDLALGKREWVNPLTSTKETKPLYDGTTFHRVIKGFMIQGGDPRGDGTGGPGYKFGDEFHPELKHDKKGVLSMANAGPNTNGSQFFITEGATPHLDNHHSVFGQVEGTESLERISKIASVATGPGNRPQTPIVINDIKIMKGDVEIPRG
jgi:peptidyl-prolyl cis-trans isomerase A (cyclophilin A)